MMAPFRRALIRVLVRAEQVEVFRPIATGLMRGLFNSLASDWEQIRADPVYRDSFSAALMAIPRVFPGLARPPMDVLDVACGTGLASSLLRETFTHARITGVDIAPAMVERARMLVPGVDFLVADSHALRRPMTSGDARPDGATPDGARPDGARPDGATPDGATPDGATPDGAMPGDVRPGDAPGGFRAPERGYDLIVSVDGVFDERVLGELLAPSGVLLLCYTKGGEIPVSRDVDVIAGTLRGIGLTVAVDRTSSWIVWALRSGAVT